MKPLPLLVKTQRSAHYNQNGTFCCFDGLDSVHALSVFRRDCGVVFLMFMFFESVFNRRIPRSSVGARTAP